MRACRVDDNQKEIVAGLRKCGITVTQTHIVGGGFVDLVCGWRGRNYLLEIKDGKKAASARLLTPAESRWHLSWAGEAHIVETLEQALDVIIGKEYRESK